MDHIEKHISDLIYEMRDDRNDGYTKEYYRQRLQKIREIIEKALNES
jgi:hypothetical protein